MVKPSARPAVFPEQPSTLRAMALPIGPYPIVAHQGGWDEILMVVAPLALIGGLLWLANRRVTAQLDSELRSGGGGPESATRVTDKTVNKIVDGPVDNGPRSSGGDGQD